MGVAVGRSGLQSREVGFDSLHPCLMQLGKWIMRDWGFSQPPPGSVVSMVKHFWLPTRRSEFESQ